MLKPAKLTLCAVSIVLIGFLTAAPNLIAGTLLTLSLAGIIILLSFQDEWGTPEFFLTAVSVISLFFTLLSLSTPPSNGTRLLGFSLAIAFLAAIIVILFHPQEHTPPAHHETTRTRSRTQRDTHATTPRSQHHRHQENRTSEGKANKRYVSVKTSNVVHVPSCMTVQRSSAKNLRQFTSLEEAKKSGLKPCKACLGTQ
ncbi:hypothetical protein D6783_04035 [Candidatus Woesearchaeota archaeon]|nr:MAG: hypothetical protein D6783_04035 [Candidatus Woesearchaeota archaeon]